MTDDKKIRKCISLTGTGLRTASIIFFSIFIVFFFVMAVLLLLLDTHADEGIFIVPFFLACFCGMLFAYSSVLPGNKNKKQRFTLNANVGLYDMCIQFPVTRKMIVKNTLYNYLKIFMPSYLLELTMCIIVFIKGATEKVKGYVGLSVAVVSLLLILIPVFTIIILNTSSKIVKSIKLGLFTGAYVLYFVVLFAMRSEALNKVAQKFAVISGAWGIVIVGCTFPLIIFLTDWLVLNSKGKEAWVYDIK